jgi:hypothetical protein
VFLQIGPRFVLANLEKDDGKIKQQGIAGKRRDNNLLVRNAYQKTIEELLTCDLNILKYASASFLQKRNQPKPKVAKSLKTSLAEAARAIKKKKEEQEETKKKQQRKADMDMMNEFDRMFEETEGDQSSDQNDEDKWIQGEKQEKKEEKKKTTVVKKSTAQVIQPSFQIAELEAINAEEKRRSQDENYVNKVDHATNTLLRFYKEATERLMEITDEYEEIQRTAAVNEGYTNEKQAQVQAIKKAEQRRKIKFEIGQRIAYIIGKPPFIKAKNVTSNELTYDMSKMYANSVETSQAQQDLVEPHKMYYLLFSKKKITQALSLVMPPAVINRFTAPYAGRIYREDFKFTDLKKWIDENQALVPSKGKSRKRKRVQDDEDDISKDEFNHTGENPNRLIYDEDEVDDDEPDYE